MIINSGLRASRKLKDAEARAIVSRDRYLCASRALFGPSREKLGPAGYTLHTAEPLRPPGQTFYKHGERFRWAIRAVVGRKKGMRAQYWVGAQ